MRGLKYNRERSRPKVKMKKYRRPKYPFYKRNYHRKVARLKRNREQEKQNNYWNSLPVKHIPINKILHIIGDQVANKWDEACSANHFLLDLAMQNDLFDFTTLSSRDKEELLFTLEDTVFGVTKITETDRMLRFQTAYWTDNSKGHRIIFDSGASVTITPFLEDFFSIDRSTTAIDKVSLQGLAAKAAVKGVGKIRLLVYTDGGFPRFIDTEAYWVPEAKTRLLSIISYAKSVRGGFYFLCDENGCHFQFPNNSGGGRITFNTNLTGNLPVASAYAQKSKNKIQKRNLYSVLGKQNLNLTRPEQELLKILFCLGHWNMQWIQGLIRKGIIKCSDPSTSKPEALCQCAACNFSKQTRKSEGTVKQTIRLEKDGKLKKNQLRVGGMVSTDQYVLSVSFAEKKIIKNILAELYS